MADIDVIEAHLDSKTPEELAVIEQPAKPDPVVEPLTTAAVEEALQLYRNGASLQQVRKTVRINGRLMTRQQVRLIRREWRERLAAQRKAKK
jgi:hypothetical protein